MIRSAFGILVMMAALASFSVHAADEEEKKDDRQDYFGDKLRKKTHAAMDEVSRNPTDENAKKARDLQQMLQKYINNTNAIEALDDK